MIWPFKKKKLPAFARERSDAWPTFVDGSRSIMCWTHKDNKQRVFLVARADGLFTYQSQYFSDDEWENCWIPNDRGRSIYDSEETAIREIHDAFPWTREI